MRLIISCTLFLLVHCGYAQTPAENHQWIKQNYKKIERYIPMRDGVRLYTSIYTPNDTSVKRPILFTRTPYSIGPYGEDSIAVRFYELYYMKYFKLGYIVVWQDVRGKFMSEGEFIDVRPYVVNKRSNKDIDESTDVFDSIDWLIKNVKGNNGNVGMFGISYPGFYATMGAISNHPALKASSPQAPVTDWFIGDDFHHNGAFALLDAFNFYSGFGKPRPKPIKKAPAEYVIPGSDNYKWFLDQGPIPNFTRIFGDSMRFWNDLISHPNYDNFWQSRDVRRFVSNIKPATLVVGGLFDAEDCWGGWETYKSIEKKARNNNKIVNGPWFHGGWARSDGSFLGNVRFGSKTSEYYQDSIEIPFFNYHLMGKGSEKNIAEATIFFPGEDKWRKFASWPPAHVKYTSIFLKRNGELDPLPPGVNIKPEHRAKRDSYSEYISDPAHPVPYTEDVHLKRTREYMTDDQRFASRRPDVLTFETPALTAPLTLAGPVVADLYVTINTTDADFVVKLIDVFPDDFKYDSTTHGRGNGVAYPMQGYQMLVRGEIMRGKFRNSFEKPEPFTPGKVTQVKFTLPDVAHTFRPGHKLMIQIQSSWFPLFDMNPQKFTDIYHAKTSDFQKATIRIHHGAAHPSKIILPVIGQ
jgi:uncharacterized protein